MKIVRNRYYVVFAGEAGACPPQKNLFGYYLFYKQQKFEIIVDWGEENK